MRLKLQKSLMSLFLYFRFHLWIVLSQNPSLCKFRKQAIQKTLVELQIAGRVDGNSRTWCCWAVWVTHFCAEVGKLLSEKAGFSQNAQRFQLETWSNKPRSPPFWPSKTTIKAQLARGPPPTTKTVELDYTPTHLNARRYEAISNYLCRSKEPALGPAARWGQCLPPTRQRKLADDSECEQHLWRERAAFHVGCSESHRQLFRFLMLDL